MWSSDILSTAPSEHLMRVAGVDLPGAAPPVVRADAVREIAVVLPRSRDPEREVCLHSCRHDGVPVIIRPSGGGAVVLSMGVAAASVLAAVEAEDRFPDPLFRRFGAAVARALEDCGVGGVRERGVSDLCLGDRKIAGSAIRLWRSRVLYQVSVLVDPDTALFERYLRMPSRQPAYRRGRSHRDFVTTLRAEGYQLAADDLVAPLERRLTEETS